VRIWADVYDVAGNRLGKGPVKALLNASVKRTLDGMGSVSIGVPATDERALALLTNERRVRVFVHQNNVTRQLATFIADKLRTTESESGRRMTVSGPTVMLEVARKSVLLGRKYDNQPISTVVNSLTGLVPGWSATIDGGLGSISARFDGVSVLKALVTIAEQNGLHVREGNTSQTLEFGEMGTAVGVRAYGPVSTTRELWSNPNVMLIDSITVEDSTEDVINWIIPLGSGEGDAALTLAKSTRTTPYPIQSMTLPDGRTAYCLSDGTSIGSYGQIEKIVKFTNIAPLENSDTNIERAANALYDAAAAWLQRSSIKQQTFQVECAKPSTNIRAGDQLRVQYKGIVETVADNLTYIDVDDDFWVLSAEESVGLEGDRLRLQVSNIDRMQRDDVEIIVGALEALEVNNTAIKSYPVVRPIPYLRQLDATHTAVVPIRLTDATLDLARCKVWVRTRPFRSTAGGAASGGGATSSAGGSHRHKIATAAGTSNSVSGEQMAVYAFPQNPSGASPVSLGMPIRSVGSLADMWTEGAADAHTHAIPNHTHPQVYAISDDTQTPNTIRIKLNGVDLTSAKGGPWQVGGGAGLFEFTLTDEMLAAVGGLRQEHQLEIRCDAGQGEVEVLVETFEIVQTLALS
jgi:hypothetical protein